MKKDLYPQSPTGLPSNFLKLPESYKSRVIIVMIAIILFVLLYLVMIAASLWLVKVAIEFPMTRVSMWTLLAKAGAVGASIMLFVFTLKFMFKKMSYQHPTNVILTEKDQPTLFAFIRKLCEETGAPFPKKIIVNEEINASVFYDKPLLSMFLPVKKNLLIGLGLVNSLNLSEFKAVLAHEFGHFSQRSMKLGSYVYMANRIIHDMVYNRDKWDDMLDSWAQSDIRIALFAWVLKAAIWVIRNILMFVYQGINMVHAALSRQMEFNADLVAVSVTGSNAIINALSKIMRSSVAMNVAFNQLATASEHQLYTNNLFFHQQEAEKLLKEKNEELKDKTPVLDNRGIPFLFDKDDVEIPNMYASHPPNFDREQNVKKVYIEGIEDTQPAWALFENVEELKQLVTKKVYDNSRLKPEKAVLQSPEEVNAFIQSEIEETTYDDKYHSTYDDRYLHLLDNTTAQTKSLETFPSKESALNALGDLYGNDLAKAMEERLGYYKQTADLQKIAQNLGKKKTFDFNGASYKTEEIEKVYADIQLQIENQYQDWFKQFDEQVQLVHFGLVNHFDLSEKEEYLNRSQFHKDLQSTFQQLSEVQGQLQNCVMEIQQYTQFDEDLVFQFESKLNKIRTQFVQILDEVDNLTIPPFKFIENEPKLKAFLLDREVILGGGNILTERWISKIGEQIGTANNRASRLFHKSVGNLIVVQERIVAQVKL